MCSDLLLSSVVQAATYSPGVRIGIINHLFRHSDKYRGFVSDRRCDSGVP